MIDFRYHIVSLVSVFLALAVGIVLGAGPLKETIGNTLTDQVELLRGEKDALRAELDVAHADVAEAEALFAAAVPAMVDGVLPERRVALILVDEVPAETVEAVVALLEQAGSSVTATAQLTEAWTDPARAAFRRSLAGTVAGYLDPAPTASEAGGRLAEALVHGLVRSAPTDPDAIDPDAAMVLELLVSSELVEVPTPTLPADAVVVLTGPVQVVETEAGTTDPTEEPTVPEAVAEHRTRITAATTAIAAAAQSRSAGAVLAGDANPASPIAALRADALAGAVATVDSVETLAGQAAVPLALAQRLSGSVGHYGVREDAEALLPGRYALEVLVRVPRQPLEPECLPDENGSTEHCADTTDGTDPGTEDGTGSGDAASDGTEDADAGQGEG